MLRGAKDIFEYPMIDRDPVPTWVDGRVALLGDAAHVMYPVGSNGASQAIVDARVLGAQLIAHGVGPQALRAYDDKLCKDISALVLRNRALAPLACWGWWTSAAAGCSTTSTTCCRARNARVSWPATRRRRGLPSRR